MSLHPATLEVVERVGEVAPAIADRFGIHDLYGSIRSPGSECREDIPPAWHEAVTELSSRQRSVLTSISIVAFNYRIQHVGAVRRIPEAELLTAKYIGPSTAAILKALGHYPEREVSFKKAHSAYVELAHLQHGDYLADRDSPHRSIDEILQLGE